MNHMYFIFLVYNLKLGFVKCNFRKMNAKILIFILTVLWATLTVNAVSGDNSIKRTDL